MFVGGLAILVAGAFFYHGQLRTVLLIALASPYERDLGPEASGTILVAGDSTAYGTGAFGSSHSIAGRLGKDFPDYSVFTISENGATTERLRTLLKTADLDASYDVIVLQIGANDILRNRAYDDIEKDIRSLLEFAKERSSHVFLMTAGNVGAAKAYVQNGVPDSALEARTREVRDLFMRVAEEVQVTYIDLFEEPATDVFLKEPKHYLAFDGLHPNALGYAYWYDKLARNLPAREEQ
jgi:lysophospholipase L1-like esterase